MNTNEGNAAAVLKHVHCVTRVDAQGHPIEVIGTMADIETAIHAAEILGDEYVAGTWSFRN